MTKYFQYTLNKSGETIEKIFNTATTLSHLYTFIEFLKARCKL